MKTLVQVGNSRGGSAAVEMALTLPILVVLISGIVDYGWYFMRRQAIDDVLKAAARIAVSSPRASTPAPDVIAHDQIQEMLQAEGILCPGAGCTMETTQELNNSLWTLVVRVSITPFQPIIGLAPVPADLSLTYTMVIEDQPIPPWS